MRNNDWGCRRRGLVVQKTDLSAKVGARNEDGEMDTKNSGKVRLSVFWEWWLFGEANQVLVDVSSVQLVSHHISRQSGCAASRLQ